MPACSGVAEPKAWDKCPNPRARRRDCSGGLLSPVPFHSLLKAGVLLILLVVYRAALPKNCLVSIQQTKAETKLKLKAETEHAQVCCQGGDRGCKSLCCSDKPDGSAATELSPSHISGVTVKGSLGMTGGHGATPGLIPRPVLSMTP